MNEIWKPVVGYETLYEVSNLGGVKRVGDRYGDDAPIARTLKTQRNTFGYLLVQLWKQGNPKSRMVHVLVAQAFNGAPPHGTEVNHKDGVKENCRADNLEYLTRGENSRHAFRLGLKVATPTYGEAHHCAKLNPSAVTELRRQYANGARISDLSRSYKMDRKTLRSAINRKTWSAVP